MFTLASLIIGLTQVYIKNTTLFLYSIAYQFFNFNRTSFITKIYISYCPVFFYFRELLFLKLSIYLEQTKRDRYRDAILLYSFCNTNLCLFLETTPSNLSLWYLAFSIVPSGISVLN